MPELLGRAEPRVFTPPLRELTPDTSEGFAVIEFAREILGVELHPWQQGLLIHALELLPDGLPRFRTVVVLVARQNGKSTALQVLSLYRMYVTGVGLVIGTAQDLETAEDLWSQAVDMAQSVPDLAAEIAAVDRTNGKKALRLDGGPAYKVKASSRRGGRGATGDLILLDELREHRDFEAWAALVRTTQARERAQVWCASNAGDATSVVLGRLRMLAHKTLGDPDGIYRAFDDVPADDTLGLFEWSAPPGCDINDPDGWAQANPSLGHTIGERAIRSAAVTDPEDKFRTEVLCQWVERLADSPDELNPTTWGRCADTSASPGDPIVLGVDVSPWMASAAIVACGVDERGRTTVEVVDHRPRTGWLIGRLTELIDRWSPAAVGLDPNGPAGPMLDALDAAGLDLVMFDGREMTRAVTGISADVAGGLLAHRGQHELDAAVAGARRRQSGDSVRWSRVGSDTDISPLVAATIAHRLHMTMADAEYDLLASVY